MTGRAKAVAFFVTLGSILVAVAIALNVSWIITHSRRVAPLVAGIFLFALIIAGLIVYTVFLVREIRRSEQHDSFINAVTHELKTPIASIRLYLQTLKSREVREDQRKEFYSVMLADADRLQYTVEQVLKAGIAGHKRRQDELHTLLSIAPLVEECVELARARHHLSQEQLELHVQSHVKDAQVFADPEDLRTAVVNLLDNAVKYSPENIEIGVEVTQNIYGRTLIRVKDRGVGIPRAQLKRVFHRFYRVPGRGKQVKGTGLGLYIVRSIAVKHGGRVHAESDGEGKGATFTIELPKPPKGKS